MEIFQESTDIIERQKAPIQDHLKTEVPKAFADLERGVYAALETYSNVHRGSGHFSMVSTHLYEQSRDIVLEYLKMKKSQNTVIFSSSRCIGIIKAQLPKNSYQILSSSEFGLSLGICALAVSRKALSKIAPLHTGGGTARLIAKDWVVWSKSPDKFEAGTPAIINIIAFAKALRMIQSSGKDIFRNSDHEKLTVAEILYHDELEKFSGHELLEELRKTLIGRGIQVPTLQGSCPFINLDNSASTPTFTPVWNAFRETLRQSGQVKQEIIPEVKSICSEFLNAPQTEYEVIFTSNTTEATNLAAESYHREYSKETEPVVLNSLLEHSSNDLPWRMVPNASVIRLSVNHEGFLDLNEMETVLREYNLEEKSGKKRIRLVAVSGVSNVLGVCNNLEEISRIAHQYGAPLLVDAAQLVAHRQVDMEKCGIDFLAFSAHKVYAPYGCGVLVARKNLLHFSKEEHSLIRSSGEENAGGIAALGKALLLLQRIGWNAISEEERKLTKRALLGLATIPGLNVYGIKDPESPEFSSKIGVIPFALTKKMSTQTGKELALYGGIGVRTGCHCAHIIVKHILQVGPGLERFQRVIVTLFPKLSLPGVARISLGIENTEDEIYSFIRVLAKVAGQAQTSNDINSVTDATEKPKLKKAEVQRQMDDFVQAKAVQVYG